MNRKAYFISGSCFILGILLGVIPSFFYIRKTIKNENSWREGEIAESSLLTTSDYVNESKPMAVYHLEQHLESLQREEQNGGVYISVDITMTEGQLAHLYRDLGQTKKSAVYVTNALENAKISGPHWLTNQMALETWVENNAIDASNIDRLWSGIYTNLPP